MSADQGLPGCKDRHCGAVIEIIEQRKNPQSEDWQYDVIMPNEIRINGQPLLAPANHPVKVHGLEIKAHDAVLVTLTLFAKRVVMAAEYSDDGPDATIAHYATEARAGLAHIGHPEGPAPDQPEPL